MYKRQSVGSRKSLGRRTSLTGRKLSHKQSSGLSKGPLNSISAAEQPGSAAADLVEISSLTYDGTGEVAQNPDIFTKRNSLSKTGLAEQQNDHVLDLVETS